MVDEIVTLQELKDHLGVQGTGRDARLELVRASWDDFIRDRTGRDWQQRTRTQEAHRGEGTDALCLFHYPAKTLTAVVVDGSALDHTNDQVVSLDEPRAVLYRTDGGVWPKTNRPVIVVSYTGGREAPSALKLAVLELAAWVENSRGGRTSMSAGGSRMDLWRGAMTDLPQAADIIDSYSDGARGYLK